jgi:3-deoxy-D-manno-octulosonate 8-phosphate phosphatase (KDO 8-P phosphatase)
MHLTEDLHQRAATISHFIFDVDGVMTDGRLFFTEQGEACKGFHVRDGLGLQLLQRAGIKIAVISGRDSPIVTKRLHALGIHEIYQGATDKGDIYTTFKQQHHLQDHQIAYMGDDLIDLPILCQAGLAIGVADSHEQVKQHIHWCTNNLGGQGAVREACEWLLQAQGKLKPLIQDYLTKNA